MDLEDAIRARRTLKAYTPETVDASIVRELLALAVLAPNHHETEPWRFWVVGPRTIADLSEATGDQKLLRSRTAIVVGVLRNDDPSVAEEDYAAVACAIENLMLAARARGLASFWRTPGRPRPTRVRAHRRHPGRGPADRLRAPWAPGRAPSRRRPSDTPSPYTAWLP